MTTSIRPSKDVLYSSPCILRATPSPLVRFRAIASCRAIMPLYRGCCTKSISVQQRSRRLHHVTKITLYRPKIRKDIREGRAFVFTNKSAPRGRTLPFLNAGEFIYSFPFFFFAKIKFDDKIVCDC